jgi:hypothetical protein
MTLGCDLTDYLRARPDADGLCWKWGDRAGKAGCDIAEVTRLLVDGDGENLPGGRCQVSGRRPGQG